MGPASTLRMRPLRRTTSEDDYKLYRAALEWGLDDPIVIDSAKDIKSEPTWKAKGLTPYDHQVTNLITFCRRLPVTLLADDVGLGKTISAGLVASELIARGRVRRILIVCPKILIPQWVEELKSKFNIKAEACAGRKLVTFKPSWDTGAIVTTYHTARLYLHEIPRDRFDMLILDEAHKLRNLYGANPIPQVAKKFRRALGERLFRYVLMLTATPIQNRLWDIYSLVDLLSVARGHENPFGSPGMFTRKYIADTAANARQLKLSAQDDFRAVVYSYMSRVRRGDAKLQFPERVVRMHTVPPSLGELALIDAIAEPIQTVNPLSQITILQALVSSPHALKRQLENMGRDGTFPCDAAAQVAQIVDSMGLSAKIVGVAALAEQLRSEMPQDWRMVVFTTRRETQTTIEAYLSERGVAVGTINGASAERNQDTLEAFRAVPPKINVIVSTEAGSEGVNLQAANVLVNYDLPWNPMIVEQRIGRVQRLQSKFANVCIYNITLAGTFEQVIVGRLMEKLQLASHAIGDIEALLEASGLDDDEGGEGLAEQIRNLVLQSLQGIDVEAAAAMAAQSIMDAKAKLEAEESNINDLLGGTEEAAYKGPKTPKLPPPERSMDLPNFTAAAFHKLGATVTSLKPGVLRVERSGAAELIRFDEPQKAVEGAVLYASGTPSFSRLVSQIAADGFCRVEDLDTQTSARGAELAEAWVQSFGGIPVQRKLTAASRTFKGHALVRARATVAHDSYDRLVSVPCDDMTNASEHARALEALPEKVIDLEGLGINVQRLNDAAVADVDIAAFCEFYEARRAQEVASAGDDARKRKKLEDEYSPRIELEAVSLDGSVRRELTYACRYKISENGREYESAIIAIPADGKLGLAVEMVVCSALNRAVPIDCVGTCAISGLSYNMDALAKSDVSGRLGSAAHVATCSLSGKTALLDEVAQSDVTGQVAISSLLRKSALSGKSAEPACFANCSFTNDPVLKDELIVSQISGRPFRADQCKVSQLSGRSGHASEFVTCADTGKTIALVEADSCAVTGKVYVPGVLKRCEETGELTHPSEMETCAVAKKPVQKRLLKSSEASGRRAAERHFSRCGFSGDEVLSSELGVSDVSKKRFRADHAITSAASGRRGHHSEFFRCASTQRAIAMDEGSRCAATGQWVGPGVLQACEVTSNLVMPSELERCAESGKKVLQRLLVTSSVSGARLVEQNAHRSIDGRYCLSSEAQLCDWGGKWHHPADMVVCDLSGIAHHRQFSTQGERPVLRPLISLLDGSSRRADVSHLWPAVAAFAKPLLGNCQMEGAELSSDGKSLAASFIVKRFLGLSTRHAGFIFSLDHNSAVGRVVVGQRKKHGSWVGDQG